MASIEQPKPVTAFAAAAAAVNHSKADLALRLLSFATTLAATVLMATANQTIVIEIPIAPFPLIDLDAKFSYSPAFIYFVVAVATTALYSLLTAATTAFSLSKPLPAAKLLFALAVFDTLILGVVASATGAGASIGYVGLKGNSHVGWGKVCYMYHKFCWHVGSSLIVSLVASIVQVLLVAVSAFSLYRRSS